MSNVVMSKVVRNGLRVAGGSMALVIVIASCASDTDTATGADAAVEPVPVTVPASSDGEVLVLRIGTNDPADSPTAPAILEFAEQVDELSGGAIVVEPVWRAAGDPVPDDWDQVVAARVIDGSLDLGFVPAAAWDVVGVTSLRALNAPFLVDSEELVSAIVSDDVADSLMAGLDDVGVTGLALVPEGLRYVFSYSDAFTTPDDFDGVTIRSPRSDTVYSLFTALGASADDPQGSEFDEQAADGVLAGAESSFGRAAAGLPGGPTKAVGNLALFPKVNAIVVNGATFTAMTETQQNVLRGAAAGTLDVTLADGATEAASAAEYCAAGGTIVEASDAELDAFVEAAAPVYTELEQDPVTGDLIERIRTLELDASAPSPITPCAPADETTPPDAFDGDTIPEGTYQRTITTADGADLDPSIVAEILGPSGEKDTELVIESDAWTLYELFADGQRDVLDLGTYSYDTHGRWITVSTSGGCSGCIGGYDWTVEDDQLTLTLADVDNHSIYDDAVRLMTEGDYLAAASEPSTSASGTYDVNGNMLTLDCQGSGAPTVILEGGTGAPPDAMAQLQARLATEFTTCAYQRASVTDVRTLGDANQDLHDLVATANLTSPFVIVGQSIGGDLAQQYARIFPDDVVGVVSMNSGPPCPPWIEALTTLVDDDFLAGEQAYCSDTGEGDRFDLIESYSESQAAPAPPDIPFELLLSTPEADWCPPDANPPEPFDSHEQCNAANAIHVELARDLVADWPSGEVMFVDAPHEIFTTEIDTVLESVRTVALTP